MTAQITGPPNVQGIALSQNDLYFNRRRSYKDDYTTPILVAIYGRVSTTHVEQLSAFENQMEWYQMILRAHPNYKVVKIYSETASGTSVEKRKEFNRMIEDALKGEFQLIITREVCRFARNTIDSLNFCRLLRAHDIEVFFVADSIYSLDTDGELRLTIFSALAQDEARKISERVRNGQYVSRAKGVLYGCNAFGYRHVRDDDNHENSHYEIDPEQAKVVRFVFDAYLQGKGLKEICTLLVANGCKNNSNVVKWDCTKLSRMLENKLYCGYLSYNKSYKQDFLSKRTVNKDKSTHVYIKAENKVPAIISEEDFDKVQEIKAAKKKDCFATGKYKPRNISNEKYISKMICSCGKTFKRYRWHVLEDGTPIYGYECRNRHDNCSKDFREKSGADTEGYCNQPGICQWKLDLMLENIVSNMFEDPRMTVDKLMWTITNTSDTEETKEERLERIQYLGNEIGKAENRRDALEMKWLDGKITDSDHDRLCSTITKNIDTYKTELNSLQEQLTKESESDSTGIETRLANIREIEAVLVNNSNLTTLKLDDEFINSFVARIVPNGKNFKWYLNIGSGRGWSIFKEDAYDLYDYWTIGYETALKFRKSRNQYLRRNQWEDLKVEVYVRTE